MATGRLNSMRVASALAAFLMLGAGAATAQQAGTSEEQAACRPDVRRLCGKIGKADEEKYRQCLQNHFQELSQKCQQVLMNHNRQQ